MPDLPRFPLGRLIEALILWMRREFEALFDLISTVITTLVEQLNTLLGAPHPFLFAVLAAALGVWLRGWGFGVFALLAFLFVESVGLWTSTMATLALILVATVLAVAVGIPVGILASRSRAVSVGVRPILDFMQTLPVFVYLLPAVFFFGIGVSPGLVATVVFATAPGVRLTELGIRGVDPEVVEAARAFGASNNQILLRVQVPLALPAIMQGVNQVIMLGLSMVVVAGLIGAPGLGADVVRSITRLNIALGVESGLSVVILAIFLDRITSFMRDRATID